MAHAMARLTGGVALAGALAVAAAGCGSSGGSGGGSAAGSASPVGSTAPSSGGVAVPTTAPGSTALPSTSTTTAAGGGASGTAGTPRCHTKDLALRPGQQDDGAGNRYLPFGLRNASGHTCTVTGYIGTALYGAGGAALATSLTRESGTVRTITLKPGAAAFFYLHWANAGNYDPPCTPEAVTRVAITPPDETTQLYATVSMGPCKGRVSTAPVSATSL